MSEPHSKTGARRLGRRCVQLLALACVAAAPLPVMITATDAGAVAFRIHAQTVGDAYQLVTSGNDVLNRRRIHQILGFGAHDLLSDGENGLSLQTLFRFDGDFGLSDAELDDVSGLRREQLSIQYAHLTGHDLGGFFSFTLGRQLHADALDFLMLDGAVLRFETPWHVGLEVVAGLEVKDAMASVNRNMAELDGVRVFEDPEARNDAATVAVGASLMTVDVPHTQVKAGYRRLFSEGKVDQEKVGGSLSARLVPGLFIHAVTSFDLYNGRFDRIQAGARWQATDFFDVEAEYVRLLPSFDADSIFNIFTAFPLNDANLRLRFHPGQQSSIALGGMLRFFGNEGYVDGLHPDSVDTVVQAWGTSASYRHRFGPDGRLYADAGIEGGYGGDRIFGDLGGTWAFVPGEWELDGRVTVVDFEDSEQPNLNATSVGYQLGGRYLVGETAGLMLMVEHNFNRLQRQSLRVLAVVDLDVWL